MAKKICISGYYGFNNFGDETVLKVLIENLKKFVNEVDVTVFSVSPENTSKEYNVKSVNTFNLFDIFISIIKCDYLISGGGSLLQDVTSSKSLLYYLFVIALAVIFNKKVIIFAQGIGPVRNIFLKKITIFLLKKASFISVRDERSFNLLSKYGINAKQYIDPVWNINTNKSQNIKKLGIQLRNFSMITDDFIHRLAQNVVKYYSDYEIFILSFQNSIDLDVCEKLKEEITKLNFNIKVKVVENKSNEKVIQDISSLSDLIGMRYHACLIGIKSGVRVLPINYDIKVGELAKNFKLNCINSINDIESGIELFFNKEIVYDEEKISAMQFNFQDFFQECKLG